MKLEDTIAGFERIINGEVDEIPEEYFMYKGTLQEVIDAFNKDQKKE